MKSDDIGNGRAGAAPRDDSAPPRFARTMGVVRWAIFGAITVFALVMVLSHFGATPWGSHAAEATQFHCPMHPTYVTAQPGDCPICGMSLVPVKAEAAAFTCPMHPEVVSDKEGRCPECGMFLVPIEAATGSHDGGAPAHGGASDVPGLVPVTLEPRRVQMIGLKTGVVARRAMTAGVRAAGYIAVDETRTAGVNVRTSGWIEKLHVNETGQAITRGAPLLTIYSQDLYAAQQDFLTALAAYDRTTGDSALVQMRKQVLDAGRDRLRLLGTASEDIARLESSGEGKPGLTLRSPFSGVVLEKNVVDGQFVMPDQTLFQIADLGTVWVLADVYERDIASLHVGAPARMSVGAFPGELFEGKVAFVYPTVSETTRTLQVRLAFPNPSLRLRPGMYAEVDLDVSGPEALAVPSEAVMDGGKTQYVFVVRSRTTFEPRLVKTGRRAGGWVEVLDGLESGETVVTSANFLIDSESRLQAAIAGMGGEAEAPKTAPPPAHTH